MSMEYIRKTYGVPAKRGARIEFTGSIGGRPQNGTIIGTDGARLRVLFDGEATRRILHPTWSLRYLDVEAGDEPRAKLTAERLNSAAGDFFPSAGMTCYPLHAN